MIVGIGVDLCSVERMEQAAEKENFCARVFTEEELAYAEARGKGRARSLAAMFAAKEAFTKALGTGVRDLSLTDICVRRSSLGAPYYLITGAARLRMEERGIMRLHLSLSHEDGLAIAFCTAERADPPAGNGGVIRL